MKTPSFPVLLLLLLAACRPEDGGAPIGDGGDRPRQPITTDQALRDDLDRLWTEHVAWTRFYLIDRVAELPTAPAAAERLVRNQADLGDAFRPFYGDDAADALTALLEEHVAGGVRLLDAALAADPEAIEAANAGWHANADAIASFLADANPAYDEATLAAQLEEHLALTVTEAAARLEGDWAADVAAYDRVQDQILAFSEVLSAGVIEQFPEEVDLVETPAGAQELHRTMRTLWQDHAIWTRDTLVVKVAALPDTLPAVERLLQNQAEIGAAMAPYLGEPEGDELTRRLERHVLGALAILDAAQAGDAELEAAATEAWYENGRQIAAFLAEADDSWSEAELATRMDGHLTTTLEEAATRLAGDAGADVAAFDQVEAGILEMADLLSAGLGPRDESLPPIGGRLIITVAE